MLRLSSYIIKLEMSFECGQPVSQLCMQDHFFVSLYPKDRGSSPEEKHAVAVSQNYAH